MVNNRHAKKVKNEMDKEDIRRNKLQTSMAMSECIKHLGIVSMLVVTYRMTPVGNTARHDRKKLGLKISPGAIVNNSSFNVKIRSVDCWVRRWMWIQYNKQEG